MKINYEAVRLYHGIEGIYSDTQTHRRLKEVRECHRGDEVANRLQKVINRKSESINETERKILQEFPPQGIDIGYYSNALIYAPAFSSMSKKKHSAIVSLIRLGFLGIIEGYIEQDGERKIKQVIAKLYPTPQ